MPEKIMKKLLEWPKDKKIVAIDFDGTITIKDNRVWDTGMSEYYTNDYFEENVAVTDWVRANRTGIYLILWTCRYGRALYDALEFCSSIDIYFDGINENIVSYISSNKILADIYIDDKAVSVEELLEGRGKTRLDELV